MAGPIVYDLTPIMRSGEERRMTTELFDIPLRLAFVIAGVAIPSLVITVIVGSIIGIYAIFVFFALMVGGVWFFNGRTSKGLKTRNWQAFLAKQQSHNGQFVLSGEVVNLDEATLLIVVRSSRPCIGV